MKKRQTAIIRRKCRLRISPSENKRRKTTGMKYSLSKKLSLAASSAIASILLCGFPLFAQSIETVKTRAGNLTLTRSEDDGFKVKIRNKVLFESQAEFGTVEGKYPRANPKLILLNIGDGALACAGHFYIVDVSKNKPAITGAFGNCNTAPKILYKNQTLTVKFPDGSKIPAEDSGAYRYGAAQTWNYRNGKLRKLN